MELRFKSIHLRCGDSSYNREEGVLCQACHPTPWLVVSATHSTELGSGRDRLVQTEKTTTAFQIRTLGVATVVCAVLRQITRGAAVQQMYAAQQTELFQMDLEAVVKSGRRAAQLLVALILRELSSFLLQSSFHLE